jgi:hypothetical protein
LTAFLGEEQRQDGPLEVALLPEAGDAPDSRAVAADQKGLRQEPDPAVRGFRGLVAEQDGVGDLPLPDEGRDSQAVAGAVQGDADDLETPGPVRLDRSASRGISTRQGPHQVAQKFSSTALPR